MAIDINNISFINYLWTKKNSDGTLTGIRLSKNNLPTDTVYSSSLDSKVNKSGDTMTGSLTIAQGSAINVSQYNDAGGVSLMNNGGGTATQFGSSSRPARMFSSVQPEWYKNGASQGVLALKSDIPAVYNGTLTIQKNGTNVATFTANSSTNQTANIIVPTKVSELTNDKGFLTAHQSIKSLNTNNNNVLNVASEAIAGSGTISLNGISKTAQEEYLQWGGPSKSGAVSPIGMTLSNEHSANRMAFINGNLITAEYSSDGGTTWTTYSVDAAAKSRFFTQSQTFAVGRPNESTEVIAGKSKTRITVTAQDGNNPSGRVYTDPRKMLVLISSATGLELLVEYRTGTNYKNNGAWTTFGTYSLSGWSGWNDIPLVLSTLGGGSTQTGNNWQLRLTFTVKTKSTSYPKTASVLAARIYGQNTWATPSTLAETGHIYTFDMSKNVTFPAAIISGTINSYSVLPRAKDTYDLGNSVYKWASVHAKTIYENDKTLSETYIRKPLLTAKGDMIYASGASNPERLGIGSNGQFLSIANGVPKWVNNPNSDTHYTNYLQIKGNGAEAVKFTQNADKSLNLKSGNNISISAVSGEITISATVPTKSSWNYDDTYVKYSAAQILNDAQKTQARSNIGAGTVTSVRVQAGTGLSSSQNTAQTSTLNTTISIASGYKLPTTTEWAERPSINDACSISAGSGIVLTPSGNSLAISVNSTSSVTSGSTALVTSDAVYNAIQSAITTALNTSV